MNNLIINFSKTNKTLSDLEKSFNAREPISIEIINCKTFGTAQLEETEPGDIFIKKWEQIDDETSDITFVTLFKKSGMIPGFYSIKIKEGFQKEKQFNATFLM